MRVVSKALGSRTGKASFKIGFSKTTERISPFW